MAVITSGIDDIARRVTELGSRISRTAKTDTKLPFAQLVGEPPQIFMLIVCGCHEPEKLGGRQPRNFTIVKSHELAA
jgi:hypothetical protein